MVPGLRLRGLGGSVVITVNSGLDCQVVMDRVCARTCRGRIVVMPEGFDLLEDYRNPRNHTAEDLRGKKIRVRVNHDATGTGTTGPGDTVVRVV